MRHDLKKQGSRRTTVGCFFFAIVLVIVLVSAGASTGLRRDDWPEIRMSEVDRKQHRAW